MLNFPNKIIDLTHFLSPEIPTWDGTCGFEHLVQHDYEHLFRTHTIRMNEGIGTHIDAPAHMIPGGKSIDQLDLNDLIAPCVVIDVSTKAHETYQISVEDIQGFEAMHGRIPHGSFVIIHTGWDIFWSDPIKYRNNLLFPSVSEDAASLLLERDIAGLGIDTLSPDRSDSGFPVHKILLGAGKYIIENVANSMSLPPMGSYSLALPLKIKGGTEAPLRLIGILQSKGGKYD